jgi:predicted RNA polymerase sigma factor
MVEGPRAGLGLVDRVAADPRLAGDHRVPAVRAHLLEMDGERDAAAVAYREAAGRTASQPLRHYLLSRGAAAAGAATNGAPAGAETNG